VASQRRLEAAQNDGEAEKIKRTKSAEASAAAMTMTAGGIAESRGIIAEGNAKALTAFRADTTLTDANAMAFMMEINRLEALRDAATHGGHTVLVTGDGGGGSLESKALLAALATETPPAAEIRPTRKTKPAASTAPASEDETLDADPDGDR